MMHISDYTEARGRCIGMIRRVIVVMLFAMLVSSVSAQVEFSEVINSENIISLASKTTLDFSDMFQTDDDIATGWFALSPNGLRVALVSEHSTIFLWDYQLGFVDKYVVRDRDHDPTMVIYGEFNASGDVFLSLHNVGDSSLMAYHSVGRDAKKYATTTVHLERETTPHSVWENTIGSDFPITWLETMDDRGKHYVEGYRSLYHLDASAKVNLIVVPSGPDSDENALVRIGRVPPPFAVTSSADGVVKRWNLETGEVTAQAKVEDGPVVFGQINASGSHLAWRDPESKALHLLNFETGEDKIVVPLDGQYLQFMFLTLNADVIIGVNIDLQPVVVAWDVATGQRYDLGEYRQCSRVPDMARLSKDGTTLVIGCDTGLDIWRVV